MKQISIKMSDKISSDLTSADYNTLIKYAGTAFNNDSNKVKYLLSKNHYIVNRYIEIRDALKSKMYFKKEPKRIDRHKIAAIYLCIFINEYDKIFERIEDPQSNGTLMERHSDIFLGLSVGVSILQNFYNKRYASNIANGLTNPLDISISEDYIYELTRMLGNTRNTIKASFTKEGNIQNIFYFSHIFYLVEKCSIHNIPLDIGV